MALSNWSSIPTSKVLPLAQHATQFQYRHYINWEVNLSGFGIGSKLGVGQWKIQFILEDGTVIFEQSVEVHLFLVSLGMMGLQFFTWSFDKEIINTTNVGGTPTDPTTNPSWKYTIGGQETSEQGTLNPGGGGDASVGTAYINAFWESPVYKLDLDPGVKLKVSFDSWGLGASTRPEYQIRFNYGVLSLTGARFGPFGELIVARGLDKKNIIQMGDSWPSHQQFRGAHWIDGASNPTVLVTPTGKRFLAVLQKDGYWEYETYDAGMTITKVKYPTLTPGVSEPEAIFGPEVTMPRVISIGKTRLAFSVRGTELRSRRVEDEGIGPLVVFGTALSGESYDLDVDDKGVVYLVNTEGAAVYKTSDLGNRWEPVPAGGTSV